MLIVFDNSGIAIGVHKAYGFSLVYGETAEVVPEPEPVMGGGGGIGGGPTLYGVPPPRRRKKRRRREEEDNEFLVLEIL